MCKGVIEIDNVTSVVFKIGNGETRADRAWLKKKKEYFEKMWKNSGQKIIRKIEDACGDTFTNMSKQNGITILLHKKVPSKLSGFLNEENPLEINMFLTKNERTISMKELLVRLLTQSFIHQQYEYHFRIREQTLFEDILADEFLAATVGLLVMGRKLGRSNCSKALDLAIEATVCRLSQKGTRNRLVKALYSFSQENLSRSQKQKADILEKREELVSQLLMLLPKNVSADQN